MKQPPHWILRIQKKSWELLREINEKTHITIVFITHEMDVAKKLFDRIAFMEDGKLKEVTDIYSGLCKS